MSRNCSKCSAVVGPGFRLPRVRRQGVPTMNSRRPPHARAVPPPATGSTSHRSQWDPPLGQPPVQYNGRFSFTNIGNWADQNYIKMTHSSGGNLCQRSILLHSGQATSLDNGVWQNRNEQKNELEFLSPHLGHPNFLWAPKIRGKWGFLSPTRGLERVWASRGASFRSKFAG